MRACSNDLELCAMPLCASPTNGLGEDAVVAERQFTGRQTLGPSCVHDVGDEHAIALAGFAGFDVEQELGHEATGPWCRDRRPPGETSTRWKMFSEQVAGVTRGNEPLDAVDVPGPVGLLDGFGSGSARDRSRHPAR